MIALVFITCLQTSPTVCEERTMLYQEQMTPMACLMNAQPELAKWKATHPNWRITSYRCGRPERMAKAA